MIRRTALIATLALGLCMPAIDARAQQSTATPDHIRATQAFLMAWGNQRWDDLRSVAGDRVTVTVGTDSFTLEPAAQKTDVMLVFPFHGMSTVRADGHVTAVKVDEIGLKIGDRETRGPATIGVKEMNGEFRVTEVSAASAPR